jgi:hypothetical protein
MSRPKQSTRPLLKPQQREAQDAAYRAAFRPHAIILTENHIPTQITFAAITGADRQLWINFEPGSSRITYIKQVLQQVRQRSPIRFYGRAVGVIVNFAPGSADSGVSARGTDGRNPWPPCFEKCTQCDFL